jgi:hypothetical protein
MLGSACGGKLWHADFSADPTTFDRNGDNVNDFAARGGGPLPGVITAGVWTVTANPMPLDTQPKQPFTTRVVVDVTMANLDPGIASPGALHTVFWINTGYTAGRFAPLFIDVARDSATALSQTITVYDKSDANTQVQLDAFSVDDDNLHHFHIDIDPPNLSYDLKLDGDDLGNNTYAGFPVGGNTDQWATVGANGGTSVFDDFQVEVCP